MYPIGFWLDGFKYSNRCGNIWLCRFIGSLGIHDFVVLSLFSGKPADVSQN